jgi:hypothetical protein
VRTNFGIAALRLDDIPSRLWAQEYGIASPNDVKVAPRYPSAMHGK